MFTCSMVLLLEHFAKVYLPCVKMAKLHSQRLEHFNN